jgi:hypothetical protein
MRRVGASLVGAALLLLPVAAHAGDEPSADEVKVHVAGDARLVLERRIGGTQLWESLCVGSCDTAVPRHGMYRIGGSEVRPSLPIALLPSHDRRVQLDVSSAYRAAWIGGVLMVSLGPLAMVGGALAVASGASQPTFTQPCPPQFTCNSNQEIHSNALVLGGVMTIILGAVLAGAGITTLAITQHSHVRQVVALSPTGVLVTF